MTTVKDATMNINKNKAQKKISLEERLFYSFIPDWVLVISTVIVSILTITIAYLG